MHYHLALFCSQQGGIRLCLHSCLSCSVVWSVVLFFSPPQKHSKRPEDHWPKKRTHQKNSWCEEPAQLGGCVNIKPHCPSTAKSTKTTQWPSTAKPTQTTQWPSTAKSTQRTQCLSTVKPTQTAQWPSTAKSTQTTQWPRNRKVYPNNTMTQYRKAYPEDTMT